MSETPIFKFKKTTSKMVGDFDVNDKSKRTLLIKPQIKDVTLFVHFEKLWNVEETAEVLDPDGNIITNGVKSMPAWRHIQGFIKDDKFVVTVNKMITAMNYHTIHTRYINQLGKYLEEGYVKDIQHYTGDEAIEPKYYVNERTSLDELQAQSSKFGQLAQSVLPISVAVTSVPTPKPQKTGLFANILRKSTNP